MKILHTADWHLGRRPVGGIGVFSNERYEDYFRAAEYIVNEAIKRKVDVFIIAGDLFDKSDISPETLFRTEQLLGRLNNEGIKVIIVEGNHDNVSIYKESWIWYLEKQNFAIFPKVMEKNGEFIFEPIEINGVKFYGGPYQGFSNEELLYQLSRQINENDKNIVIFHTAILPDNDSLFLPGCVKKEVIDEFSGKVLYMAAGHFHSFYSYPSEDPYFFIPGAPEYWDLNEKGQKGFIIFDTDTLEYTFIPSKKRKLSSYKINVDEYEGFVSSLKVENGEIIDLEIKANSKSYPNVGWIEGELLSKGALKANIKVVFEGQVMDSEQLKTLSKEQIEKELIKSWNNEFSKNVEKTFELIRTMKNMDSDENLEQIFDEFLKEIVEGEIDDNK